MDYIYIRAYSQYRMLEARHVRDEVQKAHDDKAPTNVIIKRDDGTWATIEDVNDSDRVEIEVIARKIMLRENPHYPNLPPRKIM